MAESADEHDRRAIEQVRGYLLGRAWPAEAMPAGTRVRVVQDQAWRGPWRREFSAVISSMGAPEPVRHQHAHPGELAYWVAFDQPEFDADGGGPYRKAQIWDRYLRVAEDQ